MDTNLIIWIFVGLVGMVVAAAITVGAVVWLRKVTYNAIFYFLEDEKVADAGAKLILLLVGFRGLVTVLGFISQNHLDLLFSSWLGLISSIIGVVQWAVQMVALLFIGFTLKKRKSE